MAAVPVLAVVIAFMIADAMVARKYVGLTQESLGHAARSLNGAMLAVRLSFEDEIVRTAKALAGAPVSPQATETILDGLDANAWVISSRAGEIVVGETPPRFDYLGRRADPLFDYALSAGCGSDFTIAGGDLYVRAYCSIPAEADDVTDQLVLSVVIPATTTVADTLSEVFSGAALDYGIYADGSLVVSVGEISLDQLNAESNFFDKLTSSKSAGFQRIGESSARRYLAATPMLDFEQWDVIGFALASRSDASVLRPIRGSRLITGLVGLAATVIALLGVARLLRIVEHAPVVQGPDLRQPRRATFFRLGIVLVLPSFLGIGYTMVRSNGDAAEVMAQPIDVASRVAGALADSVEVAPPADSERTLVMLQNMHRITGADYTLIRTDGSRVSTLPAAVARFSTSSIEFGPGEQTGILRIRDVIHRVRAVPAPGLNGSLFVMLEDTPYLNLLAKHNAVMLAVMLSVLLVVAVSVWIVKSLHETRTFRLAIAGYLFILPALVMLLWWSVGPLLFSLFLTFHRWSVVDPATPFVGFDNYFRMFKDRLWWRSMLNTAYYLVHIPVSMAVALAVALALRRARKGLGILRTIFYLPAVTSLVVTSVMWREILNTEFGLINHVLRLFGIPAIAWLSSAATAMPSIMMITIWFSIGYQMILFLAGLGSIPMTYYEAADIDGASPWSKFCRITLPLLAPTLLFVIVTSTIGSFQVFTPVWLLTGGGPALSTDVALLRIYREAWENLRMGYASTQAWTLSIVIFVFTVFQFRLFRREVEL